MKISIGSRIISGPWGGGNLFVLNLSNYLQQLGHEVIYDLSHKDIDLILLTDPRSRKESTSKFNHLDIEKYKKFVNSNVKVVQRINECDERKNTEGINNFYLKASDCADGVVFVSSWLEEIYIKLGMDQKKTSVILSGSDDKIFKNNLKRRSNPKKFKLVTHHWSSHHNKGFDTYYLIDALLDDPKWKDQIEFTYIGNLSKDQEFNSTKILEPLSGYSLAKELNKHDIYVTGSINEPSGNHHIEGSLCGLPVLFKESGGIPEYAEGYGESFNDDFTIKLRKVMENYSAYSEKVNSYPYKSNQMCLEYLQLFENLCLDIDGSKKISNNYLRSLSFRIKHKVYDNYISLLKDQLRNFIITIIKRLAWKRYG